MVAKMDKKEISVKLMLNQAPTMLSLFFFDNRSLGNSNLRSCMQRVVSYTKNRRYSSNDCTIIQYVSFWRTLRVYMRSLWFNNDSANSKKTAIALIYVCVCLCEICINNLFQWFHKDNSESNKNHYFYFLHFN